MTRGSGGRAISEIRRSGWFAVRRAGRAVALVAVLALATGCNYGFEGGGFPAHIQTLYIESFENRTPQFDVQQLLSQALQQELPPALGVRQAGVEVADAILRGTITRYDDVTENYRAADQQQNPQVLSNEVQIGITVQLVDMRENVIRWESSGLIGRGTYDPNSQTEEIGQRAAIENIIEQIIDGAQSQW